MTAEKEIITGGIGNVKDEIYNVLGELNDVIGAIEDVISVTQMQYDGIAPKEDTKLELLKSTLSVQLRLLNGIYQESNKLYGKIDRLFLSIKR